MRYITNRIGTNSKNNRKDNFENRVLFNSEPRLIHKIRDIKIGNKAVEIFEKPCKLKDSSIGSSTLSQTVMIVRKQYKNVRE